MSRVGKTPVEIPQGVEVQLSDSEVSAKGKNGQLSVPLNSLVVVKKEENVVHVAPVSNSRESRSMWGTMQRLITNIVIGVSEGFSKELEIQGVGYRASLSGKTLKLQLGFSHDIDLVIPEGLTVKCAKPTEIEISGANKKDVGDFAAKIRSFRPPEPYKGKGVRYKDEVILRKEGKKK